MMEFVPGLVTLCVGLVIAVNPAESRLLRQPDISRSRIFFVYAGELWTGSREGGTAQRLTKTEDVES